MRINLLGKEYGLRKYKAPNSEWKDGWEGQLGNEPTYHEYINHLLLITAELKRVLKPSGTFFFNIGDSYSGSNQESGATQKSPNGIQDITKDYFAAGTDRKSILAKQDIPAKSLMQIPERLAIKMVDEQDWILRNDLIWRKLNGMPSSVNDRLSNKYEHIFFFVKNKNYYFNLDAIRTRKKYPNQKVKEICDDIYKRAKELRNQVKLLSYNGKIKVENQEILSEKENGGETIRSGAGSLQEFLLTIRKITNEIIKTDHTLTNNDKEFLRWFMHNSSGKIEGSNPGDILTINTESYDGGHHAVFPRELPNFCIKAGCPEEGVVLDPFAGSGTTLEVARKLRRNAIGIEISEDYTKLIKKRLAWGFDPNIEWEMEIDKPQIEKDLNI